MHGNVTMHIDNINVHSILKIGSKKPILQDIALRITELCSDNSIVLCPRWLPRDDNSEADYLSRCSDCDYWSISDNFR